MATCAACEVDVEARFRFCPWCGAAQRRKVVEFFWPHAGHEGRALRVSRYFGDDPQVRLACGTTASPARRCRWTRRRRIVSRSSSSALLAV